MSKLQKNYVRTDELDEATLVEITDEKLMTIYDEAAKEEKKVLWINIKDRLQNTLVFTSDDIGNDSTVIGDDVTVALDTLQGLIDTLEENTTQRFSEVVITQRDTTDPSPLQIAVVGTGSDVLNPPTGYVQITPFDAPIMEGGFTYDATTDEVIVPVDGWYNASGWSSFRHSANNSTIAFVFGFRSNDTDPFTYSPRPTANKKPNNDDIGQISGGGLFYATAGLRLSVHMASNNSGTITVPNANLRIWLQRPGPM